MSKKDDMKMGKIILGELAAEIPAVDIIPKSAFSDISALLISIRAVANGGGNRGQEDLVDGAINWEKARGTLNPRDFRLVRDYLDRS